MHSMFYSPLIDSVHVNAAVCLDNESRRWNRWMAPVPILPFCYSNPNRLFGILRSPRFNNKCIYWKDAGLIIEWRGAAAAVKRHRRDVGD